PPRRPSLFPIASSPSQLTTPPPACSISVRVSGGATGSMDLSPRLYWEVARRAFQRQLAYRTANLAGLITNGCFGYLRAAVILALYHARPRIVVCDAWASS